jgi:F420 biosynthesis protein FbiB-like protein
VADRTHADAANDSAFWVHLESLVQACPLVIDRPKGSAHPRYPELQYPLDYGYLQGSQAMDGGGVDAWLGTLPARSLNAVLLTVDLFKKDVEIKLLLGCTAQEEQLVLNFQNFAFAPSNRSMRAWLLRRSAPVGDPLALLRARRSVRRFLPAPVSEATLRRILEAATWAPSAHHRQPWRFVVLSSQTARQRLVQAMEHDHRRDLSADGLPAAAVQAQLGRSRQRILEAPAAILLSQDVTAADVYPDEARRQAELLMGAQGVAMAGYGLLLAAQAEGLAGVWMCAPLFAQPAARQALQLPESWRPQGLVLLGYPTSVPQARARRALDEITRFV